MNVANSNEIDAPYIIKTYTLNLQILVINII